MESSARVYGAYHSAAAAADQSLQRTLECDSTHVGKPPGVIMQNDEATARP